MIVPRKKPPNYPLLPSTCPYAVVLAWGWLGMWSLSRIKVTLQGEKKRLVQDCLSHHPRVFT